MNDSKFINPFKFGLYLFGEFSVTQVLLDDFNL